MLPFFRLCCVGVLLAACAPSNVDDGADLDSIDPGGGPADNANECTPGTGAGTGPTINVDIATLDQCCTDQPGSAAHCVPSDQIPTEFQSVLEACPTGGSCVPDKFITAGGITNLKVCASIGGAPGRCLSTCVPQVKMYLDLLPPDVCDADERCVPCISPLDQKPTGVCNAASDCATSGGGTTPTPTAATCENPGAPLVQASTLPACGEGAHCLSSALVPADFAGRLADCPGGTAKCVPDAFIEKNGKFTAASCTSLYGAEGRCLNKAIPEIGAQADKLPTAGCGGGEVCAPCFNPFDGSDTGACKISCDAGPTQPARVAPSCCDNRAKCVPTQSVPAAQQETLGEDSCGDVRPDAFLCVPNELVLNQPIPACSATGLILGNYTGVCLSDCLEFGLQGIALKKGNCGDGFKCVPCERNGEPTGAPGCPAP